MARKRHAWGFETSAYLEVDDIEVCVSILFDATPPSPGGGNDYHGYYPPDPGEVDLGPIVEDLYPQAGPLRSFDYDALDKSNQTSIDDAINETLANQE